MERSVRQNYQAPNDYQFNNPGQPQRYPNTTQMYSTTIKVDTDQIIIKTNTDQIIITVIKI